MKKLIALTLAIILTFSLCACGQDSTPTTEPSNGTSPSQGESQTPDNPEVNKPIDYTINLNAYVEFGANYTVTTVNGVEQDACKPYVSFANKQFYQDLKDKVLGFYTQNDIMAILQRTDRDAPFYFDYVEGTDNLLEDGEVINFKWQFNDEAVAKLKAMLHEKVEFAYEDFAFTVRAVPTDYGHTFTATAIDMAAIEKDGIKLEDFVTIVQDGAEGKGTVDVVLDEARLMDVAYQFIIDGYTWKDIELVVGGINVQMNNNQALSNGDKVKITTFQMPYFSSDGKEIYLSDMLSVPVTIMETEYAVNGLPAIEPVDLSKNLVYRPRPLIGGNNEDGWTTLRVTTYFKLPTGENIELTRDVSKADGSVFEIGDVVTADFSSTASKYTEAFGEELFQSLKVDIKVDYLPYLPMGDNARDVFDSMDATCLANMESALGSVFYYTMGEKAYQAADMTIECIGMMYYYMNNGNKLTGFNGNNYNQLIAIYKITDAENPDGFYTYLGYNGDMYVHKEFVKATGEINNCVYDVNMSHVFDRTQYYKSEHAGYNSGLESPISFEKNGVTYPGHESLEDLFVAINKNVVKDNVVDHLIVTDSLKDFVSEY